MLPRLADGESLTSPLEEALRQCQLLQITHLVTPAPDDCP